MARPKPTFQEWLLNQLVRDDDVGRLAKAVMFIDSYARQENSYAVWRRLLSSNHLGDQLDTLQIAWTEYMESRNDEAAAREQRSVSG